MGVKMKRVMMYVVLGALVGTMSLGLNAQGSTVLRVDYIGVSIDPDGNETTHEEGVHYIADDGRYRSDRVVLGERTSLYKFPADGVNVAVNHDLRAAVRSGSGQPQWNSSLIMRFTAPLTPPGFSTSPPEPPTSLGPRAYGPTLLWGYAYDLPNGHHIETWVYEHPPEIVATSPFDYPPVIIEMNVSLDDGQQYVARATSLQRVPLSAETFAVPYPIR